MNLRAITLLICLIGSPCLFAEVKVVPSRSDVSYGPHPHQLMDIYLPPDGSGACPVLLWYGGIWVPTKGIPDLSGLFSAHCAVISVETRVMSDATLAGISPPISVVLLDARRAVQFVRLHAVEWNLDPRRIAVAGPSQSAVPALYVACAGERADPSSIDPVERVSTKVTCVGAMRGQATIDPKVMQGWVPGVQWGAPALGCGFAESLQNREKLLPIILRWSPEDLLNKNTPPIYFQYNWGLTKPDAVREIEYKIHSPAWGLGFQKLARERGVTCYVKFPGQITDSYKDIWDFLVKELTSRS